MTGDELCKYEKKRKNVPPELNLWHQCREREEDIENTGLSEQYYVLTKAAGTQDHLLCKHGHF